MVLFFRPAVKKKLMMRISLSFAVAFVAILGWASSSRAASFNLTCASYSNMSVSDLVINADQNDDVTISGVQAGTVIRLESSFHSYGTGNPPIQPGDRFGVDFSLTNATPATVSHDNINAGDSSSTDTTATAAGSVVVNMSLAKPAGATGAARQSWTVTCVDGAAPSVALSGQPATLNSTAPYDVIAIFSETVVDFNDVPGDVTVVNGTLTGIVGGPNLYRLQITPDGTGDVSVTVPAGAARDVAGNDNTVSNTVTSTFDATAPSVALSGAPATLNSTAPFNVTATFSEDVTGLTAGEITVTNGSVTGLGGGPSAYTLQITPDGNGDVSVTVPAGAAQDGAGNDNTVSNTVTSTFDATAPSVALSGAPATLNSTAPFNVTATFSEDVTGLTAGEITVTNGSVTGLGGGPSAYTLQITPDGNGDVSVTVPAGAAQDGAGNDNTVSNTVTSTFDATAPSVALSGAPATLNSTAPFNVTATFSEDVTGLTAGEITVTNGSVTGLGGGPSAYTLQITPDGNGDVSVTVPAGAAQDGSGNDNTVSNTVTSTFDATAPSVALSGAPATLNSTAPFNVTATFSEDVTGLTAGEITVTNGSVTGLGGGPSAYTLQITPDGNGDVSVTVPAGAAQDGSGNDNTVSNTIVVRSTVVEETQREVAAFMLNRANRLASNQPGLVHFLRQGGGCGSFNAQVTNGSGSLDGCVSQGNVWESITGVWSKDSSYALGTIGAHHFVNPNLIIGGMLQFDRFETDQSNASGTGWMVGPYFAAKHGSHPVYFEGRLLYGETSNQISPLGTYSDSFDTVRWLAQLRATGEFDYRNTTLMPLLDFTYTEDTQQAYVDGLGNTIPEQTVGLTQISAGLDFSMPLATSSGDLTLFGGMSGIYSSTTGGAVKPDFEDLRGRTHLGLNYGLENGANMRINGFLDGIGSGFKNYGVEAKYEMRF